MKKLFTALLLLVGFVSFSQSTGYFRYDSVRLEKVGGNSELILLNSTRDSLGFLYNIGNGRTRFKTLSSLGVASKVANGVKRSVDTLLLGDSLDRYTYIQIRSNLRNNSGYNHLRLGNLPEAQSLNGVVGNHPTMLTYNPSTFGIERIYSTTNGDIDSVFYGGAISTITRILRDSTDTYFGIGKRREILSSQGGEFVFQYFPPRDTMNLYVGRDGQCGSAGHFQFDLGHSYGYNINMTSASDLPNFPMTQVMTSMDYMRVIDNTRSHKITGVGFGGYVSKYKTYQAPITMATYEAGNFTENTFGYVAYGDAYPLISGATKAKTLAVWEAKNVYGFYVHPQYRYTNTVNNGYSFYAAGDTDIFVNKGFAYFGNNSPVRSGNTEGLRYRIYNTGKYWGTDSLHGFIVDGYGMSVNIPVAIGSQATMNFTQTDSSAVGTIGAYLVPATRAFRGMFIRSEIFNAATMDNNSTGGFVQIETGVNHAFVTRWWRNGGMVVNMVSATTDQYRLYTKFLVNGTSRFLDSIGYINAPAAYDDTTLFKPIWINTTDKKLYQGYHKGSGGGGGTSNANVGSGYLWLKPSTQEIKTAFAGIGTLIDSSSNTDGLTFKSDTLVNQTWSRGIKLVDSMVSVNNTRYWNTSSGNALTSGSQTGSYLGSTNSVPIRFRTNGTQRGYIDSARAQWVIGAPTIDANNALIIQNLNNNNQSGIALYRNDLTTALFIGQAGMTRAGAIDINTSASGISLSPNTGVYIGAAYTAPTARLHIEGSTTSRAGLRLVSTGSLPTSTNILAGNIDAISDKIYYTISTGPAQKEIALVEPSGGLTVNRIPYITGNGRLTDAGTFLFDGSKFTLQGALQFSTAQISTTTTLTSTHYVVRVDASGGAVTVDLPDATTCQGRVYVIKLISSSANAMTIDGNGTQTIDGSLTLSTSTQYTVYQIQSNGTNWDRLN